MVRITAQFLDVRTAQVLRTVKVDGRIDEIFNLQDRIVFELSQGLEVALDPGAIDEITRDETKSVEAYEAYSRGVMNLRMATSESVDRAIAQFERAVDRDPGYAEAWASLGQALNLKGQFLSIPELSARGLECLRRAIAIDPARASAHYLLGSALMQARRYDEALDAVRESLRLDPESRGRARGARPRAVVREGGVRGGHRRTRAGGEPEPGERVRVPSDVAPVRAPRRSAVGRRRRRGGPSTSRSATSPAPKVCTSSARISGSGTRCIGRAGTTRRSASTSASWRSCRRATTCSASARSSKRTSSSAPRTGRQATGRAADVEFQRAMATFDERLASGADDGATKYYVAAIQGLRGDAARRRATCAKP